jgi:predicted TIM-barrel fold metal-dependent hydrolase
MTASRHVAVREAWLDRVREEILEPGLPIVDPHHHLWDQPGERYLLDDLLRDTGSGHDIRATVFVQCGAMYRAAGPEERRPLGETEFVTGAAAQSASGLYGPTRACAGIVGMVDLTLGDRVEPLLEAHMAVAGERFRGVRNRTAWHPSPEVRSNLTLPPPGPLAHPASRTARSGSPGSAWRSTCGPTTRSWRRWSTRARGAGADGRRGPRRRTDRRRPLRRPPRRGVRRVAAGHAGARRLPEHGGEAGRPRHAGGRIRLPPARHAADLGGAGRGVAPYVETCIEAFGAARCMFESNFPVDKGMCGYAVLWNAFKRLAAGASAAEKAALFSGTAVRTSGLTGSRPASRPTSAFEEVAWRRGAAWWLSRRVAAPAVPISWPVTPSPSPRCSRWPG